MRDAKIKTDIYAAYERSMPQRIFLIVAAGACAGAAWWVLFGHVGAWLGWNWQPGDEVRRLCLGIALTIYFVRLLFTLFVFLKRAMSWSEAWTIAPWILLIDLVLAFAGGSNPALFAAAGATDCVLFGLGSWMNSYASTLVTCGSSARRIVDAFIRRAYFDIRGIPTIWAI